MKRALIFFVAFCLGLVPSPVAAGLAVPEQVAVDRFINERLERDSIPGLSIAIIRQGHVSLVRGYGEAAKGRPMKPDTPIAAASLMKSVTAAAVLQLVDNGQVDLDQPVQRYLPEFRLADPATAAKITVRFLLNQTSGLADSGFPEARLPQPASIAARVASLSAAKTVGAPGTDFHYFNPNYDLLARIVEVRTGMPFGEYVKRFLFDPLGMRSSAFGATMHDVRRAAPGLAQAHVAMFGMAVPLDEGDGYLGGAGGLITTADDLGRWLAFHGRGGNRRILSVAALDRLHAPAAGQPYAMGWFSTTVGGRRALFHNGILSGFYAEMTLFPETGDGFVILANVNGLMPVMSAFPGIREGLASIMVQQQPKSSALGVRLLGGGLLAFWLILILAAVRDLWRRTHGMALHTGYRTAVEVAARTVPLFLLIMVPWTVEHFSDRAFSVRALGLSMIDIVSGWAVVAGLEAAAAIVLLRRMFKPGSKANVACVSKPVGFDTRS